MSSSTAQNLFKYREDSEYHIKGLMDCKALFSNRHAFNDLFDAQVKFIPVSLEELRLIDLKSRVSLNPTLKKLPQFLDKGRITTNGKKFLEIWEKSINELIDSYQFYCLAKDPVCDLMWAHYAGNHQGFVLEFTSECVGGEDVIYTDVRPQLRLAEFLVRQSQSTVGHDLWEAVRTKQRKWEYEREVRILVPTEFRQEMVPINEKQGLLNYPSYWVESIIFGYRMPPERQRFIIANYPHPVKFKKVVIQDECLGLVELSKNQEGKYVV